MGACFSVPADHDPQLCTIQAHYSSDPGNQWVDAKAYVSERSPIGAGVTHGQTSSCAADHPQYRHGCHQQQDAPLETLLQVWDCVCMGGVVLAAGGVCSCRGTSTGAAARAYATACASAWLMLSKIMRRLRRNPYFKPTLVNRPLPFPSPPSPPPTQVEGLQNSLAAVSDAPGLGLSEAAELLQGELGVALVSIYGFCSSSTEPDAAVLLAAYGTGASRQERRPVTTDAAWSSCLRLKAAGTGSLQSSVRRRGPQQPAPLPGDWQLLHAEVGLCSFLVVPIGAASKPWGALMVASEDPDALPGPRWRIWPSVAAVALVHQVRHWQTAATCALLRRAAGIEDQLAFISLLLRVGGGCRWSAGGVGWLLQVSPVLFSAHRHLLLLQWLLSHPSPPQ